MYEISNTGTLKTKNKNSKSAYINGGYLFIYTTLRVWIFMTFINNNDIYMYMERHMLYMYNFIHIAKSLNLH